MNSLSSLLLVLVLGTHYAPDVLADFYSDPPRAVRALFYVARGIEGAALFAIVWALAPRKPLGAYIGVTLACCWGVIEEAQTAACRLSIGIENTASASRFSGLCDAATGLPIYALTMFGALALAAFAQEAGKS